MTMDGDHTRVRLLGEARDLYLEVGFAKFSLREVARRCNLSAPAVYRHYDNKKALLREVCGEGFRIFSSYLLRALSAPTARERLLRSTDQYLLFAVENPRDYRVIFMGEVEDALLAPRKQKPGKNEQPEPTFQFLVDRVRECINERVLKKGDPDELAVIMWTHVHGLASLRLSGHLLRMGSDAEFSRFYQRAVAQLIQGLAP